MQFNATELHVIAGALRVAAEVYAGDARTCSNTRFIEGNARLAAQFEMQRCQCDAIIARIEDEE